VSVNMILQAGVEDRMRGRIMSLYTASSLGVAPLGGLVAGAVADRIGAAHTLLLGGACCALAGLALARARVQLVAQTTASAAAPGATRE
jgi:hypothetical protein